jgi:cytochrome c oxidase subunit I+III
VFLGLETLALIGSGMSARAHAYGALIHFIVGYQFVHVVFAVLMALFLLLRARFGYLGPERPGEAAVVALFWHYTVLQWLLGYGVIHLFPLLM